MSENIETFEFTTASKKEASAAIAKYPEGRHRSAVMPLLEIAQRQCGGWLPMPAIEYVAAYLDLPAIRALEVATFYTMYNLKPTGEHLVQVCTNLPCWLRGSDNVMRICREKMDGIKPGQTTEDGMFSLMEVECLGACANAPMMQIGNDYYEDLDSESTARILGALANGETPKAGSQLPERFTCEPVGGLTSLTHQESIRADKVTGGGDD